MQGASDTNSWYDCYRGLRNKLNLEGTEIEFKTSNIEIFSCKNGNRLL